MRVKIQGIARVDGVSARDEWVEIGDGSTIRSDGPVVVTIGGVDV